MTKQIPEKDRQTGINRLGYDSPSEIICLSALTAMFFFFSFGSWAAIIIRNRKV
jgi:hypothetical protein